MGKAMLKTPDPLSTTAGTSYDASKITRLFLLRELGVIVIILLIYATVSAIQPRFFSIESLVNILLFFPFLLVVALGEMMVIISRNLDLSVGSIVGFAAIAVGQIYVNYPGFPIPLAFIAGTLIGAVLGAINGVIVTKFNLPSVIVTLGTMNIYRGLLFILCKGQQIDNRFIPQALVALSQTKHSVFYIPWIVIFAFIIALLVSVFLRRTHIGREIYAIGSNPNAAGLRGINVKLIVFLIFVISGGLSGFAGIIYMSRFGYVNPTMTGMGLEFTAIAATVIGGTSMAGGNGNTTGTVLGCILLGVIHNALPTLGISGFWQEATYGLIIIVAIIIDRLIQVRLYQAMKRKVSL
ncbi:Autoinducer 2 import system permease protein LsrC [Neomoorella glycerini]|uniref:Autoinducer 2 import system permease protein LsrC n=1 Tax=Neomoorella glycerini TaxID=55779 RepID=A0A6I5ZNZ0_9FIRM|nr:ABC transporter permease [Moorella glycerini]QGP91603.1 Autoinducer 2 import system permease protein LsrC [Moorella glycerini]